MEKNRVNFRDVDRPFDEYPKGTEFVQRHDDVVIPLPTKEEIEEYMRKKEPASE